MRSKILRCPSLRELPPPPFGSTGWPWTEETPALPDLMAGTRVWPRVTIVTPSFNHATFIEETIRSVLLQGYPNLEYIIMDGGSTDGSVEIIRRYEPWLASWRSEPDGGQSDALNQGLRRASGEIVAWLNSDDVYERGAVQRAVETFVHHDHAGLVYGRSAVIDETGEPIGRIHGRPFELGELIEGRNPVAQPSAFIRRSALGTADWLDASLHFAMDYDLWVRLGTRFPVAFVDEIWSRFRYHSGTKSGQGRLPFVKETQRVLERAFASGQLPREREREAIALCLARAAKAHSRNGEDRTARACAVSALRAHIALLLVPGWAGEMARCLVGRGWTRRIGFARVGAGGGSR
jgi:glycosyltransferase involved in cell wall biosynthesis